MMRTTSNVLAAAAALFAIGVATPPAAPAARAQAEAAASGIHSRAAASALRSAQATAAIERAAWLGAGRSSWRPPGYPRPGDSVRQHARKAARRRNQVRARRAARG